jgi:hypothetical protein
MQWGMRCTKPIFLHQHQSTQGGGLLLRTYASVDRFIEFEIGSFSERLQQPLLLGSTSPRAATSMHRGRRPRRLGSTSACAAMSACSSDEFDYFDFARRLGGPPAITRLHEDDRRLADDYFDYSSRLETSQGRASQQRLYQLLVST